MSAGVVKLAFLNSKFKKSQFFPSRAFKFWDLCRWTATRSLASRHSARASRALRLSLRLDPPVPAGACTFSRTRGAEAFVRSALWVLRQNFRKSPPFSAARALGLRGLETVLLIDPFISWESDLISSLLIFISFPLSFSNTRARPRVNFCD